MKEQAKSQARKDKLSAVMSADQVDSVAASLESLSDDAFETVLCGFSKQKKALEASDLMQELGGEGAESEMSAEAEQDKARATTEEIIKKRLGLQ
ncbi:hypothetical protein D3C86_1782450 [compost metagenome]